jgi:hypothetical protein
VGDGRTWDQVRFNVFPSRAAFMAAVFDPERLKARRGCQKRAARRPSASTAEPTFGFSSGGPP